MRPHVTPFQGWKLYIRMTQSVALGWYVTPLRGSRCWALMTQATQSTRDTAPKTGQAFRRGACRSLDGAQRNPGPPMQPADSLVSARLHPDSASAPSGLRGGRSEYLPNLWSGVTRSHGAGASCPDAGAGRPGSS